MLALRLPHLLVALLIVATVIDEVMILTLLFRVIQESYDTMAIAWLLAFQLGPAIVLTPYAGTLVDRIGAKRVVAMFGAGQGIVMFWLTQIGSLAELYVLAAILSGLFAFSGAAIFALIPNVSQAAGISLSRTNVILEITRGIGAIAGPALGGVLIASISLNSTIGIAAGWSFVIAAFVLFLGFDSVKDPSVRFDMRYSRALSEFRPILNNRKVACLFGVFGGVVLATTFSDVVFVFFTLGPLKQGALAVGLLTSVWAAGLIAGALATRTFIKITEQTDFQAAFSGAVLMGLSLFACGVGALTFNPGTALIIVAIAFLIGGVANGLHNVAVRNAIYATILPGRHGRAFALYASITRIGALIGYFLGGLVGEQHTEVAYVISGLLAILVGGAGLFLFGNLFKWREPDGTPNQN